MRIGVIALRQNDHVSAFEVLKRGAREVVAIDDFSDYLGRLENKDRRAWENFDLCREALGYSVDTFTKLHYSISLTRSTPCPPCQP